MDREGDDISREMEQNRRQICSSCADLQKENDFFHKKCWFYEGEIETLANKNDEMRKMLIESKREIHRLTQKVNHLTQKVAENDKGINHVESKEQMNSMNNVPDLNKFLEVQMVVPKEEPLETSAEDHESGGVCEEGNENSRIAAVAEQMKNNTDEESSENMMLDDQCCDPQCTTEDSNLKVVKEIPQNQQSKDMDSDEEPFVICLWKVRGNKMQPARRCRKRFATAEELGSHFGEEHLEMAARSGYICSWEGCKRSGQPLENKNNLSKHFRTHSGERPYPCPYEGCGESFADQTTVRWHINTHSRTMFPCTYPGCDMVCSHKQSMINHYRVRHSGERGFECPFEDCGMVFNRAAELRRHSHRHAGPKPYPCPFPRCTKALESKAARDVHFAQHKACGAHECPFEGCGKSFPFSYTLREHVRTHTGEKPFRCPYGCGKTFSRERNIKSHVGRKHKDEATCTLNGPTQD